MKNKKTLAVIIPNYNKSHYIKDTLDSILSQSLLPDEIIVVDDCSSDCSKEIAIDYHKKYPNLIKLYCFDVNKGVQFARNYGANKALSDYITFIDSDDFYYDINYFAFLMRRVKEKLMVYKTYCKYDNVTNNYSFHKNGRFAYHIFKHNQRYCYINLMEMNYWPFAFIVNKAFFVKIGGYCFSYNYYEDTDLLLRFNCHHIKIKMYDGCGLAVRTNSNDVSHLSNQNHLQNDIKMLFRKKYGNWLLFKSKAVYFLFGFLRRIKSVAVNRGKK